MPQEEELPSHLSAQDSDPGLSAATVLCPPAAARLDARVRASIAATCSLSVWCTMKLLLRPFTPPPPLEPAVGEWGDPDGGVGHMWVHSTSVARPVLLHWSGPHSTTMDALRLAIRPRPGGCS